MTRGPRRQRGRDSQSTPVPSGACPDCIAEADLTRDDLGIWHLTISHDHTCPHIPRANQSTHKENS